jgi:hypothetical protein
MLDTPDFPNKENCQSPLLIAQGCEAAGSAFTGFSGDLVLLDKTDLISKS